MLRGRRRGPAAVGVAVGAGALALALGLALALLGHGLRGGGQRMGRGPPGQAEAGPLRRLVEGGHRICGHLQLHDGHAHVESLEIRDLCVLVRPRDRLLHARHQEVRGLCSLFLLQLGHHPGWAELWDGEGAVAAHRVEQLNASDLAQRDRADLGAAGHLGNERRGRHI
eukprot:7362904-Pyramimonas_sp.AAC.1